MAWRMSTAEVLSLLVISAGLSVVHGAYDTAGPSGPSTNSSLGSGLIRSQGPNSNVNIPLTRSVVSSTGADNVLGLLGTAGASKFGPVSGTGNVTGNLVGSKSQGSNLEFTRAVSGQNLAVSSGFVNGPTDSGLRPSGISASADQQERRFDDIPGSYATLVIPATVLENAFTGDLLQEPVTITQEATVDIFKTLVNVIYNSVPITLTEFIKSTEFAQTVQVVSTPVDDRVFVATAPVTFTHTVTVTNTNTGYLYATEVSTDVYTVTHKAYNIRQKLITSTLQQTQVFRPTIVRTRINTEYDTQTVEQTVFNTIVIQPRSTLPLAPNTRAFTRTQFSNQQFADQGQQFSGQVQGQQNVFVRNSQTGIASVSRQTSGQVSSADQQGQQLLNLQLPEEDIRQFPILGRDGQQLTGDGQQLAGQGQQNLFVRNSQASGSGRLTQQTSGQVFSADQQGQQLLNLQLPEQDVRQFPILGRDGQPLAGQGQQNLFVRNSQESDSGRRPQQTLRQVSSADQQGQQLLNLQLPEQDIRQFPILGRDGQPLAGQGQQNLFVRNSQESDGGKLSQPTLRQVSSADQQGQQLLNLQLPEEDVRQFPILGRDGQQLTGDGKQLAGQGQQNLFVRNSQASGSGRLTQQTSGQVSNADQQTQQLLNLQLPEQDVRQFPILGRDGQPFAGQGQQNLFVRNSHESDSGRLSQQTLRQVSSADQQGQQLLNLQLPEQDIRQFPILGRDGQPLAGQGQQNLFVRNSQESDGGRLSQQTLRQVSSADQQGQQLLNLQLPEQDVRQFPILGRDGQPLAGRGQQNLFVRN